MPNCVGFDTYTYLKCFKQITPNLTIYGTNCPTVTTIHLNSENKKEFSVFPNPSNEIINIATENIPKSIEITNIFGQIILSINKINSLTTTINLTNFEQGLYFFKVNFDDKNVSGHFIKN